MYVPYLRCDAKISFAAGGASWWGCGKHIASVMDSLPEDKWCTCEPKVESRYPPMAAKADWLPAWLCNALVGGASKKGPKDEI